MLAVGRMGLGRRVAVEVHLGNRRLRRCRSRRRSAAVLLLGGVVRRRAVRAGRATFVTFFAPFGSSCRFSCLWCVFVLLLVLALFGDLDDSGVVPFQIIGTVVVVRQHHDESDIFNFEDSLSPGSPLYCFRCRYEQAVDRHSSSKRVFSHTMSFLDCQNRFSGTLDGMINRTSHSRVHVRCFSQQLYLISSGFVPCTFCRLRRSGA